MIANDAFMVSTFFIAECQNTDVPSGSVCDVIQSNVEIFYQSASGEVTRDDEQDMKDLLIETIMSQARAGVFGDLGTVESVEVIGSSQDNNSGYGDSTSSSGSSALPYVLAGIAAVVVFGAAYWYGTSGRTENGDHDGKRENVDDTSDEEHSDEEQREQGYNSGNDGKKHTSAEIPDSSATAAPLQQAEPGNWFGEKSNDEHPVDEDKSERKKAAEYDKADKSSWVAGWFGPSAPVDEEC